MPEVTCFMRRATSYGDAEDHVLLILSGAGRPLLHIEISSCCKYPGPPFTVYGTHGGLTGDTRRLEWQYFDPAAAPELQLTTTPIQKADGTPAYCSDALEWRKEEWSAPEGRGHFETMAAAFYAMLYRTLAEGAPLEITPQHVRRRSPSSKRPSARTRTSIRRRAREALGARHRLGRLILFTSLGANVVSLAQMHAHLARAVGRQRGGAGAQSRRSGRRHAEPEPGGSSTVFLAAHWPAAAECGACFWGPAIPPHG